MESRLTVSFVKVANWEREHPGEEAPGHLGISRKEASGQRGAWAPGRRVARAFLGLLTVLGRLALGLGPIRALGPGRLAGGSEPGPMVPTMPPFFPTGEVILHQGGKVFVGEMVGMSTDGMLMLDCSNTSFSRIIPCF